MIAPQEALQILQNAEEIHSPETVSKALHKMAMEITHAMAEKHPLVLSVMGGAVVFSGQLLPLLRFPLDFDYIHASRYRDKTSGSDLQWKVEPKESVAGRVVLVLDDILDEGHTMAAIRDRVMKIGAREFYCAVFAEKDLSEKKPISADFIGLTVPNRYVFGYGMDVYGAWRNLPGIYALSGH